MLLRNQSQISATANGPTCAAWPVIAGLVFGLISGPAVAQDDIQQLNPDTHEIYELGTYVTGLCEDAGPIPQDAGCGDTGHKSFAGVKFSTSGGWSGAIGPPNCEPVKLVLEGRYHGVIIKSSSDWAGDKCYENIGRVYFTETNKEHSMTEFTFEVGPDKNACPAGQRQWTDRIEGEANAYRQALLDNLLQRTTLAGVAAQAENASGIIKRQAESQLRDIEEGLDMIRDDCERIGYELKGKCDEIAECGQDISAAIRAGPASICLAVHEIFTGFRGGANSGQQAYDWFKRDAPCIAKLYDENDFLDMIDALAAARQPFSGFSGIQDTTSAGLPPKR